MGGDIYIDLKKEWRLGKGEGAVKEADSRKRRQRL